MLLPIGSDQARTRRPRLTITIMAVCFVAYVLIYWLHQVYGLYAAPFHRDLGKIESRLMLEYLESRGEEHPQTRLRRIYKSRGEARRFQEEFRKAMEEGEVVPRDSRQYRQWEEAYTRARKARRRDPVYLLGYVPADVNPTSILTHMFIHGSFWHWFGNMYFLWLVGLSLEDIWGRKYFGLLYLAGGVAAALTHHAINVGSQVPVVGASGAIAALMGAYTIRFNHARLRFVFFKWQFWLKAWIPLGFWFAREVYYGLVSWGQFTGVAVWAHIGGYAFGVVAVLVLKRVKAEETFIARSLTEQDKRDRRREEKKTLKKQVAPQRSEELEQGIEARKRGEHKQAVDWLHKAVLKNPDDFDAREELIRIYHNLERREECAKEIGELIQRFIQRRETDKALGWYNELIRLGISAKAGDEWKLLIGQELQKREDFEQAIRAYHEFASRSPRDPRAPKALFNIASILADKLEKPENALQFYDHLRARYPDWMPEEVEKNRQAVARRV